MNKDRLRKFIQTTSGSTTPSSTELRKDYDILRGALEYISTFKYQGGLEPPDPIQEIVGTALDALSKTRE